VATPRRRRSGTIFLAVADGSETRVRRLRLGAERHRNREFAARMALDLPRRLLGLGDPS